MNRLGLLTPSSLNEEQKELYDTFTEYTESRYRTKFTTKLPDGSFVGPFGIYLHTPAIGQNLLSIAKSMAAIPGLPPSAREVAILVVGYRTQAVYEHYAHARTSGFSEQQLEQIGSGTCPDGFDEKEKMAFLVASELGKPGPLKGAVWEEAKRVLGVERVTALVHYVAYYTYVATILNGFDAQVPE